ncbi:MFS general substrate transporter [Ramicandelaber brevisporus]|nr:MFS general substrate transporter [Ramicandelaber brevisporus]
MLRYRSPLTQVIILGFVCFCCPGMFNALNGMGGGGQVNSKFSDNALTALYSTFVVFGLLGGGIVNIFGPRITIFCSGFTYALYSASYIHVNHTGQQWLLVTAGALLGVGAGILWSAQGMIILSYPRENQKGRFISIFWIIFNLGGVIGGLVPLFMNLHTTEKKNLGNGVYIAFVILECIGSCLGLALAPPATVTHDDGEHIVLEKYTNVTQEFIQVFKLFTNKWMLLLFPASFSSNFFTSYQFDKVNGILFNLRTNALNSSMYWLFQMIGAACFGQFMDRDNISRRRRAIIGFVITAIIFNVAWIGGCILQSKYDVDRKYTEVPIDFTDSAFGGPFVLYLLYGFTDAVYQSYIYWVLGCLTNEAAVAARYAGFYKGIQSLGAAVSWQASAHTNTLIGFLIGNWVLIDVALAVMFVVVIKIKETNYEAVDTVDPAAKEDVKYDA